VSATNSPPPSPLEARLPVCGRQGRGVRSPWRWTGVRAPRAAAGSSAPARTAAPPRGTASCRETHNSRVQMPYMFVIFEVTGTFCIYKM